MSNEKHTTSEQAWQILQDDQRLFQRLQQHLSLATLQRMCTMLDDQEFWSISEHPDQLRVTLATAIVNFLRFQQESSDIAKNTVLTHLIDDVAMHIGSPEDRAILFMQSQQRKRRTEEILV